MIFHPHSHSLPWARRNPATGLQAFLFLALASSILADDPPPDPKKVRADLLVKYDKNGDGRLDPSERESMRLDLKAERLSKRAEFQIPADFLAKYDRDKDGEMAGDEWRVAWEAETRILRETYDADKDGKLSKEETKVMMKDVAAGKITGIPAYFAGRMANDPASPTPGYLEEQKALLHFDTNGNGLADADELLQIRNSRQKSQ